MSGGFPSRTSPTRKPAVEHSKRFCLTFRYLYWHLPVPARHVALVLVLHPNQVYLLQAVQVRVQVSPACLLVHPAVRSLHRAIRRVPPARPVARNQVHVHLTLHLLVLLDLVLPLPAQSVVAPARHLFLLLLRVHRSQAHLLHFQVPLARPRSRAALLRLRSLQARPVLVRLRLCPPARNLARLAQARLRPAPQAGVRPAVRSRHAYRLPAHQNLLQVDRSHPVLLLLVFPVLPQAVLCLSVLHHRVPQSPHRAVRSPQALQAFQVRPLAVQTH